MLVKQRAVLVEKLGTCKLVKAIYPSDANFVLVKVDDPNAIYNALVKQGVIVRNRHAVSLCAGCLRITVGTPAENEALLEALNKHSQQ